jgi:hypothetical protein
VKLSPHGGRLSNALVMHIVGIRDHSVEGLIMKSLTWALAGLVTFGSGIAAADGLERIERTIARQPAYAAKEPKYCLLVFGPKAETRVWLVLDLPYDPLREKPGPKDVLYADLAGDGDLTSPRHRIPVTVVTKKSSELGLPTRIGRFEAKDNDIDVPRFQVGDVKSKGGKTTYGNLEVEVGWYIFGRRDRQVQVSVDVPGYGRQSVGGEQFWFADSPAKAPVIWFDGALTMRLAPSGMLHLPVDYSGKESPPPWYEEFPLVRGKTMPLRAQLGTAGLGLGTFQAVRCDLPPKDVHPVAKVVFGNADPKKPRIEVSVDLKERCCGTLFQGSIAVPADVALGKAKVTLSVPGWRDRHVEPAVAELGVSDEDTRPKVFRDEER